MTNTLKALNLVLYLALSSLGIFFIIQGQVVDKFLSRKSNFAKYYEPLTELPPLQRGFLVLGKTWHMGKISILHTNLGRLWMPKTWFFGENQIEGTFSVDFETVELGYRYKITPRGFISGMLPHYKIIYTFKNTTQISQVGLKLSNWSYQIR